MNPPTYRYDQVITHVPSSGTYTSNWFDGGCRGTMVVVVHGHSETGSTDDGVIIEESDGPGDGSPVYSVLEDTADTDAEFTFYGSIRRPWFRVRFVEQGVTPGPLQLTVTGYSTVPLPLDSTGNMMVSVTDVPAPSLPAGAAQDHTAANSPSSVRLTDGTTFYKATTPSDTQPVSGTVTLGAGSAAVGTVTLGTGTASVGTVILGSGTSTVGTVNQGSAGSAAWKTDPNAADQLTWVATSPSISNVFTGSIHTRYAMTIFQPSTGARNVQIRRVLVHLTSNSVASTLEFAVVRLTSSFTPGTGGTSVTPVPLDPADGTAKAVVLTTPSVPSGSPDVLYALRLDLTSFTVGAVGASDIALYEWKPSSGVKAPKMRSSTQEGYGVRVLDPSSSATGTLTCGVTIEFTEET